MVGYNAHTFSHLPTYMRRACALIILAMEAAPTFF